MVYTVTACENSQCMHACMFHDTYLIYSVLYQNMMKSSDRCNCPGPLTTIVAKHHKSEYCKSSQKNDDCTSRSLCVFA